MVTLSSFTTPIMKGDLYMRFFIVTFIFNFVLSITMAYVVNGYLIEIMVLGTLMWMLGVTAGVMNAAEYYEQSHK